MVMVFSLIRDGENGHVLIGTGDVLKNKLENGRQRCLRPLVLSNTDIIAEYSSSTKHRISDTILFIHHTHIVKD